MWPPAPSAAAKSAKAAAGAGGLVDPLQLWGSLTQQFQQIAAGALKEATAKTAVDVTKNMATGMAKEAVKSAKAAARQAAQQARQARPPGGQENRAPQPLARARCHLVKPNGADHEAISLRPCHPSAVAHGGRPGAGAVARANGAARLCQQPEPGAALHHRPLRRRRRGHSGAPGRRAAAGDRLVGHGGRGHRVQQRGVLGRARHGRHAAGIAQRPVPRVLGRGAFGAGL